MRKSVQIYIFTSRDNLTKAKKLKGILILIVNTISKEMTEWTKLAGKSTHVNLYTIIMLIINNEVNE